MMPNEEYIILKNFSNWQLDYSFYLYYMKKIASLILIALLLSVCEHPFSECRDIIHNHTNSGITLKHISEEDQIHSEASFKIFIESNILLSTNTIIISSPLSKSIWKPPVNC